MPIRNRIKSHAAVAAQLAARGRADAPVVNDLWHSLAQNDAAAEGFLPRDLPPPAARFLILVACADERDQVRLLQRFFTEGIPCRALIS